MGMVRVFENLQEFQESKVGQPLFPVSDVN